jgi:hypothetical protein
MRMVGTSPSQPPLAGARRGDALSAIAIIVQSSKSVDADKVWVRRASGTLDVAEHQLEQCAH